MKNERSWFEKLLRGLIMVTGFYIIYRGSGILAETGWMKRLFTSKKAVETMQDAAISTYLPGYAAILRQRPKNSVAGEWMRGFFPVLENWYTQTGEQGENLPEQTEEIEVQSEEDSEDVEEFGDTEKNSDTEKNDDTEKDVDTDKNGDTEKDVDTKSTEVGNDDKMEQLTETSVNEGDTEQETSSENVNEVLSGRIQVDIPEQLKDYNYLLNHYFIVDSDTVTNADQLDAEELMAEDLRIEKKEEPQILIYHTHSQEGFLDSVQGEEETGIVGIGTYLTELLEEKYGYQVIHDKGVYDLVDGVLDRSTAYDYARMSIEQILEDNPSIEVIIDLHRDGVEGHHFVAEENGKPTAQIMFFNGLSKNSAGQDIEYLYNPYIKENLAFSFQLQMAAEKSYPDFTRNIYLKGQRFNLHLRPRSLLIEAGTQMNTIEEEKNAMEPLADILNQVLSGENRESSG